jgi:predicted ATPase
VASIIDHWQTRKSKKLHELGEDLRALGLTWKVSAQPVDDTQVQLFVGRLPEARRGGAQDLVNIADVGFGISQTLPVLVALRAAEKGRLVYIEQPEIHLHPRAQAAMARILVQAANRGVQVVVETHSSLLLRGVQTAVARGEIEPADVSLNWFSRDPVTGFTTVRRADLDADGAFGDWPEDFDDVTLDVEGAYLDAVEARSHQ